MQNRKANKLEDSSAQHLSGAQKLKERFKQEAEQNSKSAFSWLYSPKLNDEISERQAQPKESFLATIINKTPQSRIEALEEALESHKKTKPEIYNVGKNLIAEANDLLAKKLTAQEELDFNKSLDCAIDLVKNPSLKTVNAAQSNSESTIGKSNRTLKLCSIVGMLAGLIATVVCLAIAPPFSLFGIALMSAGAAGYQHSKKQSLAKELDALATETIRCSF